MLIFFGALSWWATKMSSAGHVLNTHGDVNDD